MHLINILDQVRIALLRYSSVILFVNFSIVGMRR